MKSTTNIWCFGACGNLSCDDHLFLVPHYDTAAPPNPHEMMCNPVVVFKTSFIFRLEPFEVEDGTGCSWEFALLEKACFRGKNVGKLSKLP